MLELPIGVVITLLIWSLVLELALSFPAPLGTLMSTAATVGLIAAIGWLIGRCIHFGIEYVAKDALRDRTEEASSDQRRLLTQLTVARHVTVIVIAFVVIAVVLIEFNVFRTLGVVLLTSAGAAAVIIGIAGHAVLGNLIAGLQIALTRPFRVGDSVYIEDNWGRIEDITYTYVVVNTWDKRRLVLPIRYFVSNWFENWEINQRFLMKPIYLRVDFRADVDRIRKKFFELIRADDRLDEEQEPPSVLVTDCDDETIVVRLTAGSSTATEAWYMSCETRENLLAWLREAEDGAWLPRRRLAFEDRPVAASS
jgi:small-conductance mechanosensitive channel